MLKKIILCAALAAPSFAVANNNPNGCPVPSDEKLVCAVVMCDFGLIMGEWSSECTQYKRDFAIYLATLGPFDRPPKCKMRDENCNKTGKAKKAAVDEKFCTSLSTPEAVNACLAGKKAIDEDKSEE